MKYDQEEQELLAAYNTGQMKLSKPYTEDRSLLQVRQWKEQIYHETKDLTHQEYLDRLKTVVEGIKTTYHLTLETMKLSHEAFKTFK